MTDVSQSKWTEKFKNEYFSFQSFLEKIRDESKLSLNKFSYGNEFENDSEEENDFSLKIGIKCLQPDITDFLPKGGKIGICDLRTSLLVENIEEISKTLGMKFKKYRNSIFYCEVYI